MANLGWRVLARAAQAATVVAALACSACASLPAPPPPPPPIGPPTIHQPIDPIPPAAAVQPQPSPPPHYVRAVEEEGATAPPAQRLPQRAVLTSLDLSAVIDETRDRVVQVTVLYGVPAHMDFDRAHPVRLVIASASLAEAEESFEGFEGRVSRTVLNLANRTEARLSAPDWLAIQQDSRPQRWVSAAGNVGWTWWVTPKATGTAPVTVQLDHYAPGSDEPIMAKTFKASVPVRMSLWQSLEAMIDRVGAAWAVILPVITGLAAGAAWLQRRFRGAPTPAPA